MRIRPPVVGMQRDNKNSATPGAPTPMPPAAPTVTGVSIVGSRTFRTGQTETMRAEVMLDYQGAWTGNDIINVCTDNAGFRGICREFPRGTALPFRLMLTQRNDSANGTLDLGQNARGAVAIWKRPNVAAQRRNVLALLIRFIA